MIQLIFKFVLRCFLTSIALFSVSPVVVMAQSVGLLVNEEGTTNGYTLFSPERNNKAYLIDNCGEKIQEWSFSEFPGLTSYFLEDGTLLRVGLDSIEKRDWDNNLLWSYALTDHGISQHHDIEPLPNGNILCIVREEYSMADVISAGHDPQTAPETFVTDVIIELEPVGINQVNVVWQWRFFNHLIQDYNQNVNNYGQVDLHPELIDVNYVLDPQMISWTHINSIDYNEELDQILISSRQLSEIFIIDHSTTTAEAAGHTGGNSGKGGDLLWRWGNPAAYQQGTLNQQKLLKQHDAKWIESGYVDEGKISVFNNGGNIADTASSIHIIEPSIVNGQYLLNNGAFLPVDFDWTWMGQVLGEPFHENKKSGVQALPNGNMLMCETSGGRIIEIDDAGTVLWLYRNPSGTHIYSQSEPLSLFDIPIFRAHKYPLDYAGFIGKDLTPQGPIEDENSLTELCSVITGDVEIKDSDQIRIVSTSNGTIRMNKEVIADDVTVVDLQGRVIQRHQNFQGQQLSFTAKTGIYLLLFRSEASQMNETIKLFFP